MGQRRSQGRETTSRRESEGKGRNTCSRAIPHDANAAKHVIGDEMSDFVAAKTETEQIDRRASSQSVVAARV